MARNGHGESGRHQVEFCRTRALSAHGEDSIQNCFVADCPQLRLRFNEVNTSFGPHGGKTPFYANVDYGAFGWNPGATFVFELGYLHRYAPEANGVIGQNDNELQLMLLFKCFSTLKETLGIQV